ncbi:MAG TPA: HAD hydrolase-like protein [Planctomycetota bacterium]|jgi:phosphoglycolate phosphatase-like HAD superfamily hydrolase|nr:HAD hydrolase-like protein [Planctomycetota bacterium]
MEPLLALFDIDGTLIRTDGAGRAALDQAFEDLFAFRGAFEGVRFHGATDPEILDAGLSKAGQDLSHAPEILRRYLAALALHLSGRSSVALPGACALIQGLKAFPHVHLGLVTGNVAEGARIKLSPDRLGDHFVVGAFGCDHRERSQLIRIAWDRAHQAGLGPFAPSRVVYVGDTERDVGAGRTAGVVTVGVATGPLSYVDLQRAGAHRVYETLPDAPTFLREVLECAI